MANISLYDISYTEQIIIYALYRRELYGLAIRDHVKQASNGVITLQYGSLYPALEKLERKCLVTSRWGENKPDERRGARRRYYTLTAEGEKMFSEITDFFYRLQYNEPPFEVI